MSMRHDMTDMGRLEPCPHPSVALHEPCPPSGERHGYMARSERTRLTHVRDMARRHGSWLERFSRTTETNREIENRIKGGWVAAPLPHQDCKVGRAARYFPPGWGCDVTILVAGPPCGGKTTYVAEHAAPGQSVVDFDAIVEGLGGVRYQATPEIAVQAQRIWTASLPAPWVIWCAPRRRDRGRFRSQYQAQVIVVMASLAECLKRAEDRPPIWQEHIRAWFAAWEPSRGGNELIVRSDDA
jgi:hypothetical protein